MGQLFAICKTGVVTRHPGTGPARWRICGQVCARVALAILILVGIPGTRAGTRTPEPAAPREPAFAVWPGPLCALIPPTPQDDYASTPEDQPISFFVVINDTDPDGTVIPTTITLARSPAHGFALIDDLNGVVVYVPAPDYNGPDSVDYQICDNDGECAVATLYLTVLPRNDPPTVRRDVVAADAGATVITEPLHNDDDLRDPGSGLQASGTTVLGGPFHGTLTEATPGIAGRYLYTPEPDFVGLDSFQYRVCDLGLPLPALCGSAWVQLTVSLAGAFDPGKPLPEEAWSGPDLVLGEGLLPGVYGIVPGHTNHWVQSHLDEKRTQVLLVYDTQGQLVFRHMGPGLCWSNRQTPQNLPLKPGLYAFAWWSEPLLQPWPERTGKIETE